MTVTCSNGQSAIVAAVLSASRPSVISLGTGNPILLLSADLMRQHDGEPHAEQPVSGWIFSLLYPVQRLLVVDTEVINLVNSYPVRRCTLKRHRDANHVAAGKQCKVQAVSSSHDGHSIMQIYHE